MPNSLSVTILTGGLEDNIHLDANGAEVTALLHSVGKDMIVDGKRYLSVRNACLHFKTETGKLHLNISARYDD